MYVPRWSAVDDRDEQVAFVRSVGAGDLVTIAPDGTPVATRLPVLWDGGSRLTAHVARANGQWRDLPAGARALVIVGGDHTYISPSWYATKQIDGRVVPTWNYTAVHLSGSVTVHHDAAWLRSMVTALTDEHEGRRAEPWHVHDAPDDYVTRQLNAIVGIELAVDRVEGRAKLSQNRSAEDRIGVIDGLLEERSDHPVARAMAAAADDA